VVVTFNEPVDPATFTPDKIFAFRGPGGYININGVTPIAATNNTQFRISFNPVHTTGTYTMLIGPDIRDVMGHPMDQNGNFVEGEFPGDAYVATFGVQGLQVLSSGTITLSGTVLGVRLTFNEPVDVASFTPDQAALSGPNGPLAVRGTLPVAGAGFTQMDVLFDAATLAGSYRLTVGPFVRDAFGNYMDQNGNLIPGEDGDTYTTTFSVAGPQVVSTTFTGSSTNAPTSARLVFSRPMNEASFTPDKFLLTGPGGESLDVNTVTAVPFTNSTQFDITFSLTAGSGLYTLRVGPDLRDIYGGPMDAPFTTTFRLL
jgi:hypothetical protein